MKLHKILCIKKSKQMGAILLRCIVWGCLITFVAGVS